MGTLGAIASILTIPLSGVQVAALGGIGPGAMLRGLAAAVLGRMENLPLTAAAAMPVPIAFKPSRGARETYERLAHQARLDVDATLVGGLEAPVTLLLRYEVITALVFDAHRDAPLGKRLGAGEVAAGARGEAFGHGKAIGVFVLLHEGVVLRAIGIGEGLPRPGARRCTKSDHDGVG